MTTNKYQSKCIDVSVVIPVHNGEPWIDECFESIRSQTAHASLKIEVSVFDDASTDRTWELLQKWKNKLEKESIPVILSRKLQLKPSGVGFAKNASVKTSKGKYLCFQDIDDVMMPNRILAQYKAATEHQNSIVGSEFMRDPEDSTQRFTRWANTIRDKHLYTQVYTSHGPTLIMPTWFCSRGVYDRVGGFSEDGMGVPEDLIFFYKHLDAGGRLHKVHEKLLLYRYHRGATTFTVNEETIWNIRIARLQEKVLHHWRNFTIWNAGKQGRHFFRSLIPSNQKKVVAFCDVDVKKLNTVYTYEETSEVPKPKIPIIHFSDAKPPFIICVKLDLTGGEFEKNLSCLGLEEGKDYYHFS